MTRKTVFLAFTNNFLCFNTVLNIKKLMTRKTVFCNKNIKKL